MSRKPNQPGATFAQGYYDRAYADLSDLRNTIAVLTTSIIKLQGESTTGALVNRGTWDANTNTPTFTTGGGGGSQGDYYVVSVTGTTTIDGISVWGVGDWIVNNGTIWEKSDNSGGGGSVTSVAGKTGVVTLVAADITDLDTAIASSTAFTDAPFAIDMVIGGTQTFDSTNAVHDIAATGVTHNVISGTSASTANLPPSPVSGEHYSFLNLDGGALTITPTGGLQIESLGAGVPMTLPNILDRVTLLFLGGRWIIE